MKPVHNSHLVISVWEPILLLGSLFCLALIDLMSDTDSTKIMGYYQIAGIHGLPKSLWDGVGSLPVPTEALTN